MNNREAAMIETVGDLRAFLAPYSDDWPVRFHDPDTGWAMRLRAINRSGDILEIDTEDYTDALDD